MEIEVFIYEGSNIPHAMVVAPSVFPDVLIVSADKSSFEVFAKSRLGPLILSAGFNKDR